MVSKKELNFKFFYNNILTFILSVPSLSNNANATLTVFCNPVEFLSIFKSVNSEFESNFNTDFGTLAHNILEVQYNPGFDFEKEWNYQLTKFNFTKKELILLDGLKKQVKLAVETCLKHANEFS